MDRFPALCLVLRHGRVFAASGAVGATAMLLLIIYPTLGHYSLIAIPVLFPFGYVLVKSAPNPAASRQAPRGGARKLGAAQRFLVSYIEMVQIVAERVH